MADERVLRKFVSVVSVLAITIALSGLQLVAPPAAKAADSHAAAAETALDKLAGFVDALATEGQFGKAIPTLGLIPGSADGIDLATLLDQTLVQPTGPLGGDYEGASDLEGLKNALDGVNDTDLGDSSGRRVTIDASRLSSNGVDTLPITFTFTRTVHPGLDIKSTDQPFTFSSTSGLDVQLTLTLHIDLNVRTSDDFVWLSHTASSPSLTLDALSTGFHPSSAKAAIGILGVRIKDEGSSFSVAAHLAATFADPNNDGRLAFAEPDGNGGTDPGELAGAAAPGGIVTVGWASTPGSASGTLNIEAEPSTLITSLPAASATVTVSALNLSAPNPVTASYAAGALDPLLAFERLTPKDLADALGQLAQMLTTVQLTHLDAPLSDNVNLPFMKGTLADAVSVNEAITAFLDTYVEQIPTSNSDPSKTVGRPLFSSIQDLLGDLDNPVGVNLPPNTTLDVSGVTYDATSGAEKFGFKLEIDRDPSAAEALDKLGEPFSSSGTDVTYTATSLKDPHQEFDAANVVGRTVSAGSYTAAILSVDSGDPHILKLDPAPLTQLGQSAPSSYWKGATAAKPAPDPGTAYTIAAADPLTGVAQLADTLKASSGIANANASVPVANVAPSYHVTLPVVLDLSPPTSTTPQTIDNPDGSKTVVDQLPIPAQRIKLHTGDTTPLFWLDAPITTQVDADATVGFLSVHVGGSLAACTTGTFSAGPPLGCQAVSGNTHLLSVNLVADPPGADANHDIRLPDLFNDLNDPTDPHPEKVLSAHVNGEAHAKLALTVPGSDTFFGTDHADITVDMADITHPTNVTVGGPDLSKLTNLLAFRILNGNQELDPKALFGALLNALSSVDSTFGKLANTGPLHDAMTTNIPFVGTSVQRLIGGAVTGGDGATYGDETDSVGHHHGTLTDPLIGDLSGQQKALLQGRTLTAGTVSGVIQKAEGEKITLQQAWSPQPPNGTAYSIADELRGALDDLTANSADTLQDMVDRIVAKLGGTSAAHFSVDTTATPPVLHLDLDWNRGYKLTTPVRFQVDKYSLAGTEGHGSITVDVTGQISAKLRFPLSAGAISDPLGSLKIDPSSGASVKAAADASNDVFVQASVGPLAIALGDPSHPTATNVEAHAKLGVALTDTADSSPVSLGTYAGNLTASLNQGVPAVQCANAPAVADQDLAICAALPVYTTSDGGKTWNLLDADVASSSIKVRIPRRTDGDLKQQLDPTGNLADGTTPKVQPPGDLLSKIGSAYLDLSSLDDGLLGYLKLAQQSLQLASAGGKLPLVGKDLQQGADFIAKIRTAVDAKLGAGGKPATAGGYRSAINALGQELADNGILPGGFSSSTFKVDITCTTVLEPAGKPSVAPTNPDGGTTTYQYVIVANRSGDGTADTIMSEPSDPAQNVAPDKLGDADYNTITWATSTYADHYRILRRVNNTGDFELVDTVDAVTGQSTNSYVDKKTTTSPYTTGVSAKPKLQSCPDIVPGDEVDGITVTTDLGSGDIDNPAAGCGAGCLHTTPLSIGMPGLSFKAVDTGDANNGVRAAVAWKLHLKFGLSRKLGFHIAT